MAFTEIYVDVLILINIFVTFLLLQSSICIANAKMNIKRILLSSVLGGVSSLLMLLDQTNYVVMTLLKLIISIILVYIAFENKNKFLFVKHFMIFYFINFIYAGVVFAIWYYIAPKGMVYKNSFIYFDISAFYLVISMIVSYCVIKVISYFLNKNIPINQIYNVEIEVNKKQLLLKGFVDTGNKLTDITSGKDICVCSANSVKELFSDDTMAKIKALDISSIEETQWKYKIRLVPVKTISGQNLLPIFKPDLFFITLDNKKHQKDILIGISKDVLYSGEYDILLTENVVV